MTTDVLREVEQLLYREARLLDEQRFREWLDLFTDDVRYWLPVTSTRYTSVSKAITRAENASSATLEATADSGIAIYDETKVSLSNRIARLETGLAWAEDPPSRTSRIVTNVEVEEQAADRATAYSKFITHRMRLHNDEDFYIGRREDEVRKVDGQWRICSRKIMLDQSLVTARNLSILL